MSNSFATPWTIARQAPLSMDFPGKDTGNGLPFPSPGDLPDPEIEPGSPALQVYSLSSKAMPSNKENVPFPADWDVPRDSAKLSLLVKE